MFRKTGNPLKGLHGAAAELLSTSPSNISFHTNTSEALNMIANGYPFRKGDSIVSYIHEYPSNHYPWVLQEKRGAELRLLQNSCSESLKKPDQLRPCGFDMNELEKLTDKNTRMIALSHVQFTSGFAADLKELGSYCRSKNIDLVIDAAQSLGSLPINPDEWGIQAVAASGWKWMMGPIGTGLLYTSPEFREKISLTMAGAELMEQGQDYLNHSWNPLNDARRFEYSTLSLSLAVSLESCINEFLLPVKAAAIKEEIFRLQNVFLKSLNNDRYGFMSFDDKNRSGILAVFPHEPELTGEIISKAFSNNLLLTERSGYIRIAPHYYNTDEEMIHAAEILNDAVKQLK